MIMATLTYFGLPEAWIAAVMAQESGFRPDAYADDSNGGTWGLPGGARDSHESVVEAVQVASHRAVAPRRKAPRRRPAGRRRRATARPPRCRRW